MSHHIDWQQELAQMLISAGTAGLKQTFITVRFATRGIRSADLVNELEALRSENKVQKFELERAGRPTTVWRATTEILPKKKR